MELCERNAKPFLDAPPRRCLPLASVPHPVESFTAQGELGELLNAVTRAQSKGNDWEAWPRPLPRYATLAKPCIASARAMQQITHPSERVTITRGRRGEKRVCA